MDSLKLARGLAVLALVGVSVFAWGYSQAEPIGSGIANDYSGGATAGAVDETREGEVVGQVVDVSCYLAQGLKGDSHRQCAEICANNLNVPLNIMDDDGQLWQLVDDDMPGRDQNPTVVQFAEQRVRATGTLFEKGPNRAIIVRNVELVEGTANPTALENSADPEFGRAFNQPKGAANPCGGNPCAGANPCAANPCGGK